MLFLGLFRTFYRDFKPLIRNSIIVVVVVKNIKDIVAVFIFLIVRNPIVIVIAVNIIMNSIAILVLIDGNTVIVVIII